MIWSVFIHNICREVPALPWFFLVSSLIICVPKSTAKLTAMISNSSEELGLTAMISKPSEEFGLSGHHDSYGNGRKYRQARCKKWPQWTTLKVATFVNRNILEEMKTQRLCPKVKILILNVQVYCGISFIGTVFNYYPLGEPKPIFLNEKRNSIVLRKAVSSLLVGRVDEGNDLASPSITSCFIRLPRGVLHVWSVTLYNKALILEHCPAVWPHFGDCYVYLWALLGRRFVRSGWEPSDVYWLFFRVGCDQEWPEYSEPPERIYGRMCRW